jgi:hypothetical protein
MMDAESQAVLNMEDDFQEAIKNGRSSGNGAYVRMGNTSRVMVASRSKVSSRPDISTSPGNYGWFFVGAKIVGRL